MKIDKDGDNQKGNSSKLINSFYEKIFTIFYGFLVAQHLTEYYWAHYSETVPLCFVLWITKSSVEPRDL